MRLRQQPTSSRLKISSGEAAQAIIGTEFSKWPLSDAAKTVEACSGGSRMAVGWDQCLLLRWDLWVLTEID